MTQRFKICPSVLVLGIVLLGSYAYADEPRSSRVVAESSPQAQLALAASIPRRELEFALLQREDVLADVEQRIKEMGVSASADELTDLLWERENLSIGIDKCGLGIVKAGCRTVKAKLAEVETIFREKTGLSTQEFRSGRRDTPGSGAAQVGTTETPRVTKAGGDSCTCSFQVYSLDRWMNRYWGLECHGHASHGVCSNNVDSGHTPGIGAMVGDIDLYFGGHNVHRDCPDDQYTCFRGPSTDHVGSWGNACSCDTWHSQYYNPYTSWYGGDLTDSSVVYQLSTGYLTAAGACSEVYVSVGEYIAENDPWCCDDPMGSLFISLPLADGYGTTSGPAAVQNCNGGSQSGRYPYCGTFGATIHVVYNCSTYSPPPPPICDPQQEADCWNNGWIWDSYSCTCSPPQSGCEPIKGLKRPPDCF